MLAWDRLVRRRRTPGAPPARPRGGAVAGGARHAVASAARLHEQLRHPPADAVLGPRGSTAMRSTSSTRGCTPSWAPARRWRSGAAAARRRRAGGPPGAARGHAPTSRVMFLSNLWARQEVQAGLDPGRPRRRPVHGHAGRRQSVAPRGARRPRRSLREGLRGLHAGAALPPGRLRRSRSAIPTRWRRAAAQRPRRRSSTCRGRGSRSSSSSAPLTPPRVQLNDARYSGPTGTDGWSGMLVPVVDVPAAVEPAPRPVEWQPCAARFCQPCSPRSSPPCRPASAPGDSPAHRHIADRMIALLPAEIRPLFEARRAFIVDRSVDPDLWRNVGWDQEPPNHFLDLDSLRRVSVRRAAARVRPGGAEVRARRDPRAGTAAVAHGRVLRPARAGVRVAVASVAVALRARRHRALLGRALPLRERRPRAAARGRRTTTARTRDSPARTRGFESELFERYTGELTITPVAGARR